MMKTIKLSILFIAMSGLLFTLESCSKDDSPPSPDNGVLEITAGIEDSSADNLEFTSGYVWLREVVFDGDFASGESIIVGVGRFSQIDFETGIATPALNDIPIPTGQYVAVNLDLELRDEDAQPSVVMEGTYTRTDTSVAPIRFEFNSGEVFQAETIQQLSVARGQVVTARIIFDPGVWFSPVSTNMLDNADVDVEGTIVISETSNPDIFDAVADRLDVSTQSEFQ